MNLRNSLGLWTLLLAGCGQSAAPTAIESGDAWYLKQAAASPAVKRYSQRMGGDYAIMQADSTDKYVILEVGENHADHFSRAFSLKVLRQGGTLIDDGAGEWKVDK